MMDHWHWILLAFVVVMTGAGFVQSCLGFGFAVVALAVLPYFMDVRLANLSLSLSVLPPTIMAAWAYREHLEWCGLLGTIAGAMLLMPVGLLAFAYLPADALVRGTGIVILASAVQELRSQRACPPRATSRWRSAGIGALSGFLSGAIGIGGPPIAAYAVRQPWPPMRLKAFLLTYLVLLSMLKAMGVLVTGWVDQTVLLYAVVAVPFAMLGTHFGIAVSRRIDPQHFRQAILAMLILVSAGMALRGSRSAAVDSQAAESLTGRPAALESGQQNASPRANERAEPHDGGNSANTLTSDARS